MGRKMIKKIKQANQLQDGMDNCMTKLEFACKMQEEVGKKVDAGIKIEVVQNEAYMELKFIPAKYQQFAYPIIIEKYYEQLNQWFNDRSQARADSKNILVEIANGIIEEYSTLINWIINEINKKSVYREMKILK